MLCFNYNICWFVQNYFFTNFITNIYMIVTYISAKWVTIIYIFRKCFLFCWPVWWIVIQRKFAMFEISTYNYGKSVRLRENLKVSSCSWNKHAPDYVKNLNSWKKSVFVCPLYFRNILCLISFEIVSHLGGVCLHENDQEVRRYSPLKDRYRFIKVTTVG